MHWRGFAKQVPGATGLRDLHWGRHSTLQWALAPFRPNSAGSPRQLTTLTLDGVQQLFAFLDTYRVEFETSTPPLEPLSNFGADETHDELRRLFTKYGSDKGTTHRYDVLYTHLLDQIGDAPALLEVGLGTADRTIASNMGPAGKPGASLRAFRDYLPGAAIYGADIDEAILFQDERIRTFFVDQTDLDSVRRLVDQLPPLDLVIDDGLHSPGANMAIIWLARRLLKTGAWLVVEDISFDAIPVWRLLLDALRADFDFRLIDAESSVMVVGQRR